MGKLWRLSMEFSRHHQAFARYPCIASEHVTFLDGITSRNY